MKKFLMSLAVVFLCLLAVPSEKADAAAKMNKTKVTVYAGNTTTLKVTGTSKKVTWKSSNTKVATVKNGKVTTKKKGSTTITAKAGSKKLTCKVTVKNVALSNTSVTLTAGSSKTIKLTGAFKKVTWKTSNAKVVKVSNGKLTAVAKGNAKVYAKHNGKTYTCKVTVKAKSSTVVTMKVDKELINEESMKDTTDVYLKQLTIKSQKTSGDYVYYQVTKASYDKMMANIKKDIDSEIKAFLANQSVFTKVTYNSKVTKFNLYIDMAAEDNMSDAESEAMLENMYTHLINMYMDAVYYQAFSGVLLDDVQLDVAYYDAATNKEIDLGY